MSYPPGMSRGSWHPSHPWYDDSRERAEEMAAEAAEQQRRDLAEGIEWLDFVENLRLVWPAIKDAYVDTDDTLIGEIVTGIIDRG